MSQLVSLGGHERRTFATRRQDPWWLGPTVTFVVFSAFVLYSTWAALQGEYYYVAPYLSPMYAPPLFTDPAAPGAVPVDHTWFGTYPSWWPRWDLPLLPPRWAVSPAWLILVFPLSFRLTCYYYRKAYYRAFALTPPGCAVQGIREGKYNGEVKLLVFQNLHRFALYFALLFLFFLSYDAIISFSKNGQLGIGVGSVIQTVNVVLIVGYTLGCHSLRHLVGGRRNDFSCGPGADLSYKLWLGCTRLNARHMFWAWASLLFVGFTDLYIRLCAMGVITDLNTWD
jgi:hypothetical protein